jgi:predicted RNA-binding protein with RPS1 domain
VRNTSTYNCRVIEVDLKKKRVLLSLKKSILAAKTPPITTPSAATPGARTHGWITGITDVGVFIGLYNNMKGLVPVRNIDLSNCSSPKDLYHVGQVVKCTVVRGDAGKGMLLSLAGPAAAAAAAEAEKKDVLAGLEPGMVVQGAIVTSIRAAGKTQSEGGKSEGSSGPGEQGEVDSDDGTLLALVSTDIMGSICCALLMLCLKACFARCICVAVTAKYH